MEVSLGSCSQFKVRQWRPQNSDELFKLPQQVFVKTKRAEHILSFRVESRFEMEAYKESSVYNFEKATLFATAIACNVQVVEVVSDYIYKLHQCIFTCKTLVDLTLNHVFVSNVLMDPMIGTTVYLPALKKLELRMVLYESKESFAQLISGCPALEELIVDKGDSNVVCVSPTLTRLDLDIPFVDDYDNLFDTVYEVKLDTPALKYLKLHDKMSENFSVGRLASLTEADVSFGYRYRSVLEFVGKLNNVSSLKLQTDCVNVLDSAFAAFSVEFRNLTKLELIGDGGFVTKFLEISDNLEVLIICMVVYHQHWIEPKQVPFCLINHLRTVYFDLYFFNSKCSESEFNMVRYILRNAKVLKTVKINISINESTEDLKKESEAVKRISLFERASEACQLEFV